MQSRKHIDLVEISVAKKLNYQQRSDVEVSMELYLNLLQAVLLLSSNCSAYLSTPWWWCLLAFSIAQFPEFAWELPSNWAWISGPIFCCQVIYLCLLGKISSSSLEIISKPRFTNTNPAYLISKEHISRYILNKNSFPGFTATLAL